MTKSYYQDIVSHEQNGISSIELRHALEAFTDQNKRIFSKVADLISKFSDQQSKIKELESLSKKSKIEVKEAIEKANVNDKNPNSQQLIQK